MEDITNLSRTNRPPKDKFLHFHPDKRLRSSQLVDTKTITSEDPRLWEAIYRGKEDDRVNNS